MADSSTATLLRLLSIAQYSLHSATTTSNPSSFMGELHEALDHPQPGDWVMEMTTIWDPEHDNHRFGRLIVTRREVIHYDDEEEAADNFHEELTEPITFLELLDGTLFRWTNCKFLRLLPELPHALTPISRPSADVTWCAAALRRHGLDESAPPEKVQE